MRHYNGWLWGTLKEKFGALVEVRYAPLITVNTRFYTYRIWCPPPQDYIVSTDCVNEVSELGANIISYASAWGKPSLEATTTAKIRGISILPHRATIELIEKK